MDAIAQLNLANLTKENELNRQQMIDPIRWPCFVSTLTNNAIKLCRKN